MILSDIGIKLKLERDGVYALEKGYIKIDPLDDPKRQIGPASVDLRLGRTIKRFQRSDYVKDIVDVYDPSTYPQGEDQDRDSHILWPGEFVLGHTVERIRMPSDLCGFVSGRSSLGRLGIIVHATANMIEPLFDGQITLEIANLGPRPVWLYSSMYVCQIMFSTISSEPQGDHSKKYLDADASGPVISKLYEEKP